MKTLTCWHPLDIDQVSTKQLLQESWAKELTPNMLKAFGNKDYHELTVSKLNQLIEAWISKRDTITAGFQSVFGKLIISRLNIPCTYNQYRRRVVKRNSKGPRACFISLGEGSAVIAGYEESVQSDQFQSMQYGQHARALY